MSSSMACERPPAGRGARVKRSHVTPASRGRALTLRGLNIWLLAGAAASSTSMVPVTSIKYCRSGSSDTLGVRSTGGIMPLCAVEGAPKLAQKMHRNRAHTRSTARDMPEKKKIMVVPPVSSPVDLYASPFRHRCASDFAAGGGLPCRDRFAASRG